MNYTSIIIPFLGGLGMFIYGMQIMAQGLENAAGNKMKSLLEALTKNKLLGVLLGAFITAVIQSSSATTVMVVGFVNAGIMNLTQAMGVIMGANIGTTVTGWLVSSVEWAKFLSPTTLAPIAIMIGVVIMLTGKRRSTKDIASIIVGFGLLFVGISTMSGAVDPLKESEGFVNLFVTLGKNPLLGIIAGALVTAIIQSSSASVGILQSLAAAGLVPFNAAIYIIMGQNNSICISSQNTQHQCLRIIHENRTDRRTHSRKRHRFSNLNMQIFVQKFRHDVQSSGRCIRIEQKSKSNAHDKNITDRVKHHIICQRLVVRKNQLKHIQKYRH